MKIQIETILNKNSMKLINSAISFTNTYYTLQEVEMALRKRIINLKLQNYYVCGRGSKHVWLSRKKDGERILLIKK